MDTREIDIDWKYSSDSRRDKHKDKNYIAVTLEARRQVGESFCDDGENEHDVVNLENSRHRQTLNETCKELF